MNLKDKVKSHLSMWKGDVGSISGVIKRENCKEGDLIHVIFPETDKHYGYQQSFNSKDLIMVEEISSCDCQDYENGLVSYSCSVHNDNPIDVDLDYPPSNKTKCLPH